MVFTTNISTDKVIIYFLVINNPTPAPFKDEWLDRLSLCWVMPFFLFLSLSKHDTSRHGVENGIWLYLIVLSLYKLAAANALR